MSEMRPSMFQAIVEISGAIHLHSQLFPTFAQMKAEIAKNKAYTLLGYSFVIVNELPAPQPHADSEE